MTTTPSPLSTPASAPRAVAPAPVTPHREVRLPRVAANHDRRLQERDLFARYHGHSDVRARDELVARFLPLATRLAQRYQRGAEPLDDLVQVASMGLLKAIDRFDPDRGTAFSSFAVPTIAGELKRYFRDKSWAVRVPRALQELTQRVDHTTNHLVDELARTPTVAEVAGALGITPEQVLEAREAATAYRAESLDRRCGEDEDAAPGRRHARRRRARLPASRASRHPRNHDVDPERSRARDSQTAVRRGPHTVRDRSPDRRLTN